MLDPTTPSPSGLLNLKTQNVASKIHLELTITTDENIEAVELIVMRDRQLSISRIAYDSPISTTTVYEIMSNHWSMKKTFTRWVTKLRTPIQRANRVDCCHELL